MSYLLPCIGMRHVIEHRFDVQIENRFYAFQSSANLQTPLTPRSYFCSKSVNCAQELKCVQQWSMCSF